jgi:hypothetical protein
MTEDDLPNRQKRALRREKLRAVSWPHVFMKRLEMLPEGGSRISKSAMRERIRHKLVTEVVVGRRYGNRFDRQHGEAQNNGQTKTR